MAFIWMLRHCDYLFKLFINSPLAKSHCAELGFIFNKSRFLKERKTNLDEKINNRLGLFYFCFTLLGKNDSGVLLDFSLGVKGSLQREILWFNQLLLRCYYLALVVF